MSGVSNVARSRWLALAASILLLDASISFHNVWPTPAVGWHGELSAELAVCLLLLAILAGRARSPSTVTLRVLSIVWVVLMVGRYANVTAPALYGREINLYWDVRHLSGVASMLARAAPAWLVLAVVAAAVLIPLLLYAPIRWAFGRVTAAMADARARQSIVLGSLLVIALFAAQRLIERVPSVPTIAVPVVETYARQLRLLTAALSGHAATTIGAGPSMDADLKRVAGADVFIVFMESYGAVSYDRPEFVAGLAASRAQFEGAIHATGRDVVSAFVESPTFGGSSWLAHISLLSGIEVRDEDTNVLMMSGNRETLVNAFARRGYRTVALMPGLQQSWPEGAFFRFDEIYGGVRLNYQGPPFGWWIIPDQFAVARLDALEINKAGRAPSFAFFATTSTHTPFKPVAPYQPAWARVLTDTPYDPVEVDRAMSDLPDWLDLGPSYLAALNYTYEYLGGYLRLRADRDFVMVLLGDHQPPAVVSGEGARWDVPVHIIASRPALLERFRAHGFQPGLVPQGRAISRMHELTPVLLDAFSDRQSATVAAAR